LVRAGYDVGKVDGVLGLQSRVAVKAMQVKYGLPADAWPTAELLARMRGVAPVAATAPIATNVSTVPRPASAPKLPRAPAAARVPKPPVVSQ